MNLGRITQAQCINAPPSPDARCEDDAFRIQHPEICAASNLPRLVIKPSVVLLCALGSVQFRASYIVNGVETDVTDQSLFQSSDPNVAVIGAASGNATGVATGSATISALYAGLTVTADATVLGEDCCDEQNVAMMVVVDQTKSMSQAFSGSYPTKLHYAKAAATRFISEVNETKDLIGLMSFTETGFTIHSAPVSNKTAVSALVPAITQTQQSTRYFDALTAAIASLNGVAADRRVIVLISDGEDQDDSYSADDNPITLLDEFKGVGGIVICLGVRAHGPGYELLSEFSTGGFLINGYDLVAATALDYLSGLKGYICAGNCIPDGDTFESAGTLNYCGFANWNVVDGHVDLLGNGFLDLLPGNGLYVDLAGSRVGFKGRMETKNSYALQSGKTYSLALNLAGNQRVNASSNSVRAKVYHRNSDILPDQDLSTIPVLSGGAGSAAVEIYEYAFSYLNGNGETALTPAASITNGGFATFTITLSADAAIGGTPSLVRFWKRELGTTKWYLLAEGDPVSAFTDTLNNARLAAAISAATIDPCNIPVEQNTTGTPIVLFEQTITINDFEQDFGFQTFAFTAPYDVSVWVSIQQTETPAGYDAIGLLLDRVTFKNATDLVTLLDDDFDDENVVYVPPKCGLGSNYVLIGYGAEEVPGGITVSGAGDAAANGQYFDNGSGVYTSTTGWFIFQDAFIWKLSDPSGTITALRYSFGTGDLFGLWDTVENGQSPPPTVTDFASVPVPHFGYLSGYNCYGEGCLDGPPAVQLEDPSPLVDLEKGVLPPQSFNSGPQEVCATCVPGTSLVSTTPLLQTYVSSTLVPPVGYIFSLTDGAAVVRYFTIGPGGLNGITMPGFVLSGSADGVTWTELFSADVALGSFATGRYLLTGNTAYLYYRATCDSVFPTVTVPFVLLSGVFGAAPAQVCATASATSEISLQDAINKAKAAASLAANLLLAQYQCLPSWTRTVSYTAQCPLGTFGSDVTKAATKTSLNSEQEAIDLATAAAAALAEAALDCAHSNNDQPITIPQIGKATPYPSVEFFEGVTGFITKVVLNLFGLTHASPDDLQLLLVSPAGTKVKVWQNAGGVPPNGLSGVNIVLNDTAGSFLSDAGPIVAGTYKPTQYAPGGGPGAPLQMDSPAPVVPYQTTLAAFNGETANGAWSLYVADDLAPYGGSIVGGWSLTITTA